MIRFGGYQLHPVQGLTRGAAEVRITPRSLSVLRVLAERAGQVVTKDEIFRQVWAGTAVSDTALTSCIQELRHALDDDARHPRFIETLHRRGYRFLPITSTIAAEESSFAAPTAAALAPSDVVGREPVLAQLREAGARANAGVRQVLFVTGEPGVGKTTVVQAFLSPAAEVQGVRFAWGQGVEHYGAGEPYQPVLEALTRLCRQPAGEEIIATFERHAPTWLAQLPGLLAPERLAGLQRTVAGTTRERMLRELTSAVEAITARAPLVLWLDDLHWSDASTLDWIAGFAQRPEPARVMLVGTFRRSALPDRKQPLAVLADTLRVKGLCREIVLEGLDEEAVAEWVTLRFPPAAGRHTVLNHLARLVQRHSAGNALFVVNVMGDLVARSILRQESGGWNVSADVSALDLGIPDDVRRMIERQLDHLEPHGRSLLEIASVAGAAFSAAAVAAAARQSLCDVESSMAALARQHRFVREAGVAEWPDGTVATRFEFLHALYREVLYQDIPAGRRAELHRRVATCEETAYGPRAAEIAAELAMHFQRGRDGRRAVTYLQHAADNARRRSAYGEARTHFDQALTLLANERSSQERDEREVSLWIGLGGVVMAIEGWGSAEAERAYSRARALCQGLGDTPRLFPALWGLWLFYWGRGLLDAANDITLDLLELARRQDDDALMLQAHHAAWATAFSQGRLAAARLHATEGMRMYEAGRHAAMTSTYGSHDAGACARQFLARTLALQGSVDEAITLSEEAVAMARTLRHPFTEALALVFAAAVRQAIGDAPAARRHAIAAAAIAREQGFRLLSGCATALDGWALVNEGQAEDGMRQLADGIAAARTTGSEQFLPHFLALHAEACLKERQVAAAVDALDEAWTVVERTGERFHEAEIHRLRGEAALARYGVAGAPQAEAALLAAVDVARTQGAHLLTARASGSLERIRRVISRPSSD